MNGVVVGMISKRIAQRIASKIRQRHPHLADWEKMRRLCQQAQAAGDTAAPARATVAPPAKTGADATPFVSIVIPCYGRQELLNDTLWSCLEQDYAHFEVIVIDDASPEPIVIPYASERIRLFRLERNRGESVARNYGIRKARGAYIKLLDSDDLFVDNGGLRRMAEFAAHTLADFVYCGVKLFVTETGRVGDFPQMELNDRIMRRRQLWPTQMLLRRELCVAIRFPEDMRYAEDWAFTLAVFRSGQYDIRYLPQPLVIVRLNAQSQSLVYGPLGARYFEAIERQRRKVADRMKFESDHAGSAAIPRCARNDAT